MSDNRRFLSVGLIIAAARTAESFELFEFFMLTVSPRYSQPESRIIHRIFVEYTQTRRDLWILIGTQQPQKKVVPRIIQTLCKVWSVLKNKGNETKHDSAIERYLELAKKLNPDYQVIMSDIIKVFKN